ncbi:5-(carboxyamino)imidazole ribonucleotide synthase [Methylophilaceae bacterium]|nr:5-(carboxyamino)imidazole ribonucleotide synthase [Methylophilaceae bacterium]|tara:strand:+ start:29561 stop:30748 length:1188 start_codon:yes stop_codon:yes gene_type:complete
MQSNLGEIIKTSKSLGILGGGQLGKFFTAAAQKMGYSVVVFDPDKQSPAGKIAEKHICKLYNDLEALDELKSSCTAVTTEFENVPAETLRYLEKDIVVRPSSKAIAIAQNRIKEKNFLKKIKTPEGLMPVGNFLVIDSIDSINNIDERFKIFPGILKIAQFGYDGKGQIHVNNKNELKAAFKTFNSVPCTLELKLNLESEFSVVLARSVDGKFIVYPTIKNSHNSGILEFSSITYEDISSLDSHYINLTKRIANELNYIGVMAVEWFVAEGNIFVNEIAPRPHNSGHFSIDACVYDQFDQQVLALTGNELKKIEIEFPRSVMLNILGDLWFRDGVQKEPKFEMIAGLGINLHLYGKAEPRIGRKMGHITILGLGDEKQQDIMKKACSIRDILWKN